MISITKGHDYRKLRLDSWMRHIHAEEISGKKEKALMMGIYAMRLV